MDLYMAGGLEKEGIWTSQFRVFKLDRETLKNQQIGCIKLEDMPYPLIGPSMTSQIDSKG